MELVAPAVELDASYQRSVVDDGVAAPIAVPNQAVDSRNRPSIHSHASTFPFTMGTVRRCTFPLVSRCPRTNPCIHLAFWMSDA